MQMGKLNTEPELIIATYNQHKLKEIREILGKFLPNLDPLKIQSAAEFRVSEPVEDGVNFAENALIKARAIAFQVGIPALADDSGICVDILGGAPGIFSARWAGKHGDDTANLDLLLAQLADVPAKNRGASFVCCAALVLPNGKEFTADGKVAGTLRGARAGTDGFGYDPIFQPIGMNQTLAEVSAVKKNQISHRARAFEKIALIVGKEVCGV